MSISRFIAIILFCNVYLIGQSQEFINFYPWVSGGLSASNWRSDPDPQQSGAKTGCIYSDVNIALSGGAWQTSNPQWAYNVGGMAAADGFGMKLGVNWTNVNQTVTFTITFRNAPSGAITEYPVDFSIFDINSHVCGATSLNRFIDVVSVVGYKADLTTSVNPSSIVPSCAQNIVTGNSVKGSGSCGNSETTVAFNSSNAVARIVITYSSGTGDPASLNCAGTPPQLLAGNDPRAQEIFLTPFRLIAPSSSAPTGITGTSSICSGNSTTLAATGGNSSTKWYTGSCGGTLVGTGSSITVSPGSTTTYYAANQGLCGITSCASIVVNVASPPNAGTNGVASFCSNGSLANLFASLGGSPSSSGTWSGPSSLGGGNLGTYNPVTMNPGTYTYTVTGTGGCPNATATVSVTETAHPNAGTNGTTNFCSNGSSGNLFASLGGSPSSSGTWSGPSALTGGNLGTYNPVTMTPGTYTYTVTGSGGCVNATATVSVSESVAPNAGTDGTLAVCAGTIPTDAELFASLTGTPQAGGSWSNVGLVYTYTVNAIAPCTGSSSASVTVSEQQAPNAGTDGTLAVCAGTIPTDAELFASLTGTPQAGGSWSNVGLVYTYIVNAIAPCTGSSSASVTVSEQQAPNAGTDGTLTVCAGTIPTDAELFASLTGTPQAGGSWSNVGLVFTYTVNAIAPCTGSSSASVTVLEQQAPNAGTDGTLTVCAGTIPTDAELFASLTGTPQAGGSWSNVGLVYTYTVAATAPCTSDATASVTVTEQVQPNAGTNGTLDICQGTTVTTAELFAVLGGTPDVGGTWSPALAGAGTYTYTVAATAPCATDATAQVVVTEITAPDAGTDGTLTICQGSTVTVAELFASLGGTPDAGGTWSPALAGAGTYTYTVTVAGCSDATASVTVTEQVQPNAGTSGTLDICQGSTVTNAELFSALSGTPDAGGTWSPALAGAGTYTYTVAATAPCTSDATALVELIVSPCDIIIPTAFTPNGDNANDEWEILGLDEQYIENQVFVYNRWGSLIYESTQGDYTSNPWDGTHNLKPLPVGSYYYIIVLEEGSVPLKGTISLIMK